MTQTHSIEKHTHSYYSFEIFFGGHELRGRTLSRSSTRFDRGGTKGDRTTNRAKFRGNRTNLASQCAEEGMHFWQERFRVTFNYDTRRGARSHSNQWLRGTTLSHDRWRGGRGRHERNRLRTSRNGGRVQQPTTVQLGQQRWRRVSTRSSLTLRYLSIMTLFHTPQER